MVHDEKWIYTLYRYYPEVLSRTCGVRALSCGFLNHENKDILYVFVTVVVADTLQLLLE